MQGPSLPEGLRYSPCFNDARGHIRSISLVYSYDVTKRGDVTLDAESQGLAAGFEAHRTHLRAVAYRMLGSLSEADDAVQEAWLRVRRSEPSEVENLRGWLTTVVGRVCLDMLRQRASRREQALGPHVPEPLVSPEEGVDPEHEALLAESVGLALLIVLEALGPAQRLAFVLHDMFAVPFDEIATILDRSPSAARKLASRARHRVQAAPTTPDRDLARQREVVDALFAAARDGDFEALVALLAPDVVLRADLGVVTPGIPMEVRGAPGVAERTLTASRGGAAFARPALVNGAAGAIIVPQGRPVAVIAFTIAGGKIVEIDILADRARLERLDMAVLNG
jgi:RNA polymerase sigma factor (sigma-70 family)